MPENKHGASPFGWRGRPGWLGRQAAETERRTRCLPDWIKRAAGLDPGDYPDPRDAVVAAAVALRDARRLARQTGLDPRRSPKFWDAVDAVVAAVDRMEVKDG